MRASPGSLHAVARAFSSSLLATASSPSLSLFPFVSCTLYERVTLPVFVAMKACKGKIQVILCIDSQQSGVRS